MTCFTTPSLQEHCFNINNVNKQSLYWAQLIWLVPNAYTNGVVAVNIYDVQALGSDCGTSGIAYVNGCWVPQYAQFSGSQGAFGYSQYPYILRVASWTDSFALSTSYTVNNFIHPDW